MLASGAPVHVGPHAFDLLVALVERSGYLVSKDELLQRVWGKVVVEENTLQVHVSALRKVLGADAIATVSGRGYRFVPEVVCIRVASTSDDPIRKHNFPHQLTSFIGREKEIAKIKQLLASTRLLTLTGAGGCGKTRLALQVAGEMLDSYPHGGWLVEFAPLGDATLVPQTVANVFAVKEQAGRDLSDTVAEWLQSKRLLLVLDNAEHLARGVHATRRLTCCDAVTSSPFSSPAGSGWASLASWRIECRRYRYRTRVKMRPARKPCPARPRDCSSIAPGCSGRISPSSAKDTAPLASICRRLDGIALAIELAAPRVRSMSLEELSRHLDDRFGVLTGGCPDGASTSSHIALADRLELRPAGGFREDDAASRVRLCRRLRDCEAQSACRSGENVHGSKVLDLLTSLADKNLFVTEAHDDVTRFSMLETVRHYARDRLQESGEEASVRARHLAYFLAMAEAAERQFGGADRAAWLERIDSDRDNLRSALSWSLSAGADAAAGLRLAGALGYFWWRGGTIREGRGWLSGLLAAAPKGEDAAARAKACHGAGILAQQADDYPVAQVLAEEALTIRKQLGDRHGISRTLANLGMIASCQGDYRTARTMFDEALTICRETDDRHSTASVLVNLGTLASDQGDYDSARAFLEESLAIWRALGGYGTSNALGMLGRVAHGQGDYPRAQALLEESLAIAREEELLPYISAALADLGSVARSRGDHDAALALLKEALTIQREVGERLGKSECLEAFAAVVLALGKPRLRSSHLGWHGEAT